MRINKSKLKIAKLITASGVTGEELQRPEKFLAFLKEQAQKVQDGQKLHRDHLCLKEEWGIGNIIALLDCIE